MEKKFFRIRGVDFQIHFRLRVTLGSFELIQMISISQAVVNTSTSKLRLALSNRFEYLFLY